VLNQPESVTGPKEPLRAEARREARRALELEPHNGEAYLALEMAMPPLAWKEREALLLQGTTMDPNFEPGFMMEGRLLAAVGRGSDAQAWLQQAHDQNPLHNGASWSLALSLAEHGRVAESRALVAKMQRQWPRQMSTGDAQHFLSLVTGATDDLIAQLADPNARPASMDQQNADIWIAVLKARGSNDPAAKPAAIKQVKEAADAGILNHGHAMLLLTMLGDLDGAFAQAELYQPINAYAAPHLFLSITAPLSADPRFMLLARKFGFVAYWQETGHWPDFCSQPGLPYDCRVEANKVIHTAAVKTRSPF